MRGAAAKIDEANDYRESQDELVKEAWRLSAEILQTGQAKLASGKVIEPKTSEIIRHVQWLASLGKLKPKSFGLPKEAYAPRTDT